MTLHKHSFNEKTSGDGDVAPAHDVAPDPPDREAAGGDTEILREKVEDLRRDLAEAERDRAELKRSLDETLDIRYLSADLLMSQDAESAAKNLIELSRRIISFEWASVLLYDEDLNEFVAVDTGGVPADIDDIVKYQTSQGIIDWVIGEGRPIVIPDISAAHQGKAEGEKHLVIIPLMVGTRGIGVLEMCSSGPRDGYSSLQLELESILASQAAIVIDNARLRARMDAKIREMMSFFEIGKTITSALALEDLLGLIVGEAMANTRCELGCVHLVDPVTGELVKSVARSDPRGGLREHGGGGIALEIAARVVTSKRPIMVPDVATDPRFSGSSSRNGIHSVLGAPMLQNNEAIGALTVAKGRGGGQLSERDVDLVSSFARQAAVAVRMSRLYSEQAEAERRLRASQAELLRASKLAAIGLLAGGVAHELNNPLQVILGLSQILIRNTEGHPEYQRDLRTIERETIRIAGIVSQLLKSSRRLGKKGKIESIDINSLLEECISLMSHQIKHRNINLVKDWGPGPCHADGDIGELEQVFLNMMTNAVQAMPNGGTLEVRTRRTAAYVEITFSDTGMGIPARDIDRIFDPFFTTKPAGKGTGLGLYICYSVIEKHRGSISVNSTEGEGTTFKIRLPVKAAKREGEEGEAVESKKGVEQ